MKKLGKAKASKTLAAKANEGASAGKGEETVLIMSTEDAQDFLAARGVVAMAEHKGRDLPEMAHTTVARSGRMVGLMLADLHTVRASEREDIETHIAEAEQLFARALRQGVEIEMSEHKRRKAGGAGGGGVRGELTSILFRARTFGV